MDGSRCRLGVSVAVNDSSPPHRPSSASSARRMLSSVASIRSACEATTFPAAVNRLPRPCRVTNRSRVAVSSVRRCIDADGWVIAARVGRRRDRSGAFNLEQEPQPERMDVLERKLPHAAAEMDDVLGRGWRRCRPGREDSGIGGGEGGSGRAWPMHDPRPTCHASLRRPGRSRRRRRRDRRVHRAPVP